MAWRTLSSLGRTSSGSEEMTYSYVDDVLVKMLYDIDPFTVNLLVMRIITIIIFCLVEL
jgi:hypothetical protein